MIYRLNDKIDPKAKSNEINKKWPEKSDDKKLI